MRTTRLPREILDGMSRPFARFLRIEAAAAAILLGCTAIAMLIANSPAREAFAAWWDTPVGLRAGTILYQRTLHEWVNEGAVTLFFFLVALELKREWVLGELRKPGLAALPVAAAIGGMAVPAALYWMLQHGRTGAHGWGVVMATDTALVVGCLALLSSRIPRSLRVFMLSCAIIDDLGAILVVAIGYSHGINWWPLFHALAGMLAIRALAKLGVRGFGPYVVCGIAIWMAIDASGIHATVTGVIVGLMTPARRWVNDRRLRAILSQVVIHPSSRASSLDTPERSTLQLAEIAARESLSPIERLLILLHPWVALLVMPAFALANAGITLSHSAGAPDVTWAIFLGLALGKPLGILSFIWLALTLRLGKRPADLDWHLLIGGALLAGIGFTMSLLIAGIAFDAVLIESAKRGILLASLFCAVAGLLVLGLRRPH